MAQTGVVGTQCVVAQAAGAEQPCGERTRERARETLQLHARTDPQVSERGRLVSNGAS